MAITALLIGVSVAGGATAAIALSPKVKVPDAPPAPVAAPAPPAAPVLPAAPPAAPVAAAAAARVRRGATGAVGRSDTILTGPRGLGELQPVNTQVKTLLGY